MENNTTQQNYSDFKKVELGLYRIGFYNGYEYKAIPTNTGSKWVLSKVFPVNDENTSLAGKDLPIAILDSLGECSKYFIDQMLCPPSPETINKIASAKRRTTNGSLSTNWRA